MTPTRCLALLLAFLCLATPPPAAARGEKFSLMLKQLNPMNLVRTARQNYTDHRYYATDLTEHGSVKEALGRSFQPVDARANIRSAVLSDLHPISLVTSLVDPLSIEITRELGSGEGINPKKLMTALNPIVIGTTLAGGTAGDIAGAGLQSVLAGLGPVGATAGFFARPMLAFAGQILGMNVGAKMAHGGSFAEGVASAFRSIDPGRDGGQMVGGVVGSMLGQALIPIPIVGGIIGGTIGGLLGTSIGSFLGHHGPTAKLNHLVTGWLHHLADMIDPAGKDEPPKPAAVPLTPAHAAESVSLLGVVAAR